MARSLVDAPFDVLWEQGGSLLIRLREAPPIREGLLAMGFPLDAWEAELRTANDAMSVLRAKHGGLGRIGVSGQLGADHDERVAWVGRAADWVKLLRKGLPYATLQTKRDLTVPIREVRRALSPHQRHFPGTLEDLRRVMPVLRTLPDLVAVLGAPDLLCEGETLLAEGEVLAPVLRKVQAEARQYQLDAEAARQRVIERLRLLLAALPLAVKDPERVAAFLFAELHAWRDGTGREPGRVKRPRRRKAPTAPPNAPTDPAASPAQAPTSPVPPSGSPTVPTDSPVNPSDSPTPPPLSPKEP